jgi:hypothetical protein
LEAHYARQWHGPFTVLLIRNYIYPEATIKKWDLGYLGTYSDDRQPPLQNLMLDAAGNCDQKFVVGWRRNIRNISIGRKNVERIEHLPPAKHRLFTIANALP